MTTVESSLALMVIAYPLLFVVMAVFAGLTYFLNRMFQARK